MSTKTGLLAAAIAAAVKAHGTKVDKAGELYILHPLRVMGRMTTDDLRILAVLHDVPEDHGWGALAGLDLPERLQTALDALTRRDGEAYEAYLGRVKLNALATLVKAGDLADNTDPRRLARLAPTVAAGLRRRYADAKAFLNT